MSRYRKSMEDAIKEVNEYIDERKLTPDELKRREEIAKELPDDEFKKKYGSKWMGVKMATATKMAKNEERNCKKKK